MLGSQGVVKTLEKMVPGRAAGSPTCKHRAYPKWRWEHEPAPHASVFPARSLMFSPLGKVHVRWVGPYGDVLLQSLLPWLQHPGMLLIWMLLSGESLQGCLALRLPLFLLRRETAGAAQRWRQQEQCPWTVSMG